MMKFVICGLIGGLVAIASAAPAPVGFQSPYLSVRPSPTQPAFEFLSVDPLGGGQLKANVIKGNPPAADEDLRLVSPAAGQFVYVGKTGDVASAVWTLSCEEKAMTLRSHHIAGESPRPFAMIFHLGQATLLGLMPPGERRVSLPCLLHLPGKGSMRISCNVPGVTLVYDARRHKGNFVKVELPAATAERALVEYRFEVTAIYPPLPGIEGDARFDGFRRDWLTIFQLNPRLRMLANNSASDSCAFCIYKYAEMARHTPQLADGLRCLELIRMTVETYLAGGKGYGMVGYLNGKIDADIAAWLTPWTSSDSYPSLLIAACIYGETSGDLAWEKAHYEGLLAWAKAIFDTDKDGNGLIEYPGSGNRGVRPNVRTRPSNWWDTINFGHEDAYSNALAYDAGRKFAALARRVGQTADAELFTAKTDKLRAAYVPTFLNPATGVLAGWKSADGQLHDYWFTFVQGAAITYGLVEPKQANEIMDRLLKKMEQVGYTRFDLGLPGNLVPVPPVDYFNTGHRPQVYGEPKLEDGSDGFQYYENGGATGCFAYFTIHALYKLGRVEDARRIFYPMLKTYAAGEFSGHGPNNRSRDWRTWKGECVGYEGLLVDAFLPLLTVLDDQQSRP